MFHHLRRAASKGNLKLPSPNANIRISPRVLAWARITAGFTEEELAGKIRSKTLNIRDLESSGSQVLVTVAQVENIADVVRRPVAALLLESPPRDPAPPTDFRRPARRQARPSPQLNRAIRRARRLQRIATDTFRFLGDPGHSDIPTQFSVTDNPTVVASDVRSDLNIPDDIHRRWQTDAEAFRTWRELVEQRNVLVLGADIPGQEAQGFSLSDTELKVIVLRNQDAPARRCFTLWHEFGHLLLNRSGLCFTDELVDGNWGDQQESEDWCNRFAEAVLITQRSLEANENKLIQVIDQHLGYEATLQRLARRLGISQQVVLFRMCHAAMLPDLRFWSELRRLDDEQREAAKEAEVDRRSGPRLRMGRNIPREVVRDNGPRLTRGLLLGLDSGVLTRSDLAGYLGARLKHLDGIRREVHR